MPTTGHNGQSLEPLPGVKHFGGGLHLSPDALKTLLDLMPNATSWSLPSSSGSSVVPVLLKSNRKFTGLTITRSDLPDEVLIELIEMCADSLECLELFGPVSPGSRALSAICRSPKLRHLRIWPAWEFGDFHMAELVSNAPDLITVWPRKYYFTTRDKLR